MGSFGNQNEPGYISPIRYWVQIITPLVYDDSISLYELMGKVVKKLNDVIEIVNPLGAGIEDTVNKYLDKFKDEWEKELIEFESQVNQTINSNNEAVNIRIDNLIKTNEQQFNDFENSINEQLAEFNSQILERIATITALISSTDEANRVWTLSQIQKLKSELEFEWPPVIDPTDGLTESVQTALNHMWDAWRGNALTAQEYDELQLTAEGYDAYGLTAKMYDDFGKLLLKPDTKNVMVQGVPVQKNFVNMEAIRNGSY